MKKRRGACPPRRRTPAQSVSPEPLWGDGWTDLLRAQHPFLAGPPGTPKGDLARNLYLPVSRRTRVRRWLRRHLHRS